MRHALKFLFLILNFFVIFGIFLAFLCTRISPEKNFVLPYFGFAFAGFFALNFCFIIFWFLTSKKVFSLFSLATFFCSLKLFLDIFPINFQKNENFENEISVLSYNISLFGENKKVSEILDFIEEKNADIVCLQEFGFYATQKKEHEKILKRLRKTYPFRHIWYKNQREDMEYGVVTFSKFPIVKKEKIQYSSQYNISICSDIVAFGDTVRVFNNHLESTKFSVSEKNEVKNLSSENFQKTFDLTERLSKKLGKAYKIRAAQANKVAHEIARSPHKVIVCGDFNDIPTSYCYTKIRGDLHDAFAQTAFGFDYTFAQGVFFLRIDHVLSSFLAKNCEIFHTAFSDHDPVFAVLGW